MQHKDYWAKRFEMLENAQNNKAQEYYYNLQEQYRKAIDSVEKDLAKWYTRYATENKISLTEAKRLLNSRELVEFRMSVDEYIEKGKTLAYSGKWAKQLEAASVRVHVSRLEALKVQMQQQAEMMGAYQMDALDKLARTVYTDGYYHTAYELQKGIGVGWDLMRLDTNKIDKLISKPWAADGKVFSERVWGNTAQLVSELETKLTQSIIRGQSPKKAISEIAHRFNVSKSKAGRLVMTESAFFASAAQKDCYNDLGVEQFEILATLDTHTSEICRSMDGKVTPMGEYKPGVTAPPFHVWCRSTTVPYFDDEFTVGEMRAARDENGKYYLVPASMKYNEWFDAFVKGGSKAGFSEATANNLINAVTSMEEAKKALIDRAGFKDVDPTFETIDNDLAVENTNQLLLLEEKFGAIHQSEGTICAVNSQSANAFVSKIIINPAKQKLSLCPSSFNNRQRFIEAKRASVKSGWSMPMALTDEELAISTVTHEYGHILQNTLVEKAMKAAGWDAKKPDAFVNFARKTHKAMLKWYIDIDTKIKKQCFDEIVAIAMKRNPDFKLSENLSQYGHSNYSEFFAEVFANSQLSKPNELGKAMNIWLKDKGLIKNDIR